MHMLIDGRRIASDVLADVREDLPRALTVRAVVVSPTPATESYLSIKDARAEEAGMHLEVVRLPEAASEDEVIEAVTRAGCDAVLVQLPLPERLDSARILDSIPLERDADVLSRAAYERFREGDLEALQPPVVSAVSEILARAGVSVRGKRAVVVGQGRLVGEPVAAWLVQNGADLSIVTRESGDLSMLKDADIVITGAGSPGLITPDHLKQGVALIDAGTSESGGAIVGDADPACAPVCSVFTPVPGGVGPVAVACLFRNAAHLFSRALQDG